MNCNRNLVLNKQFLKQKRTPSFFDRTENTLIEVENIAIKC
jgi:hypothetical protein